MSKVRANLRDDDTIVVSNHKSIDDTKRDGGCGYWATGQNQNLLVSEE
jgi:hypothetical protein